MLSQPANRDETREPKIGVSLVLATLGPADGLEAFLHSLAEQQDAPSYELIVVDQNQDSSIAPVLRRYQGRISIVHVPVDFRGASRARNTGARLASGDWLGFPDDDCELLPNTLMVLSEALRGPGVGVVTGRTVDFGGASNLLRWKTERTQFSRFTMFRCLSEATLFVRKDVFLSAGGFDERFGPGSQYPAAEGVELMNRLFGLIGAGQAVFEPKLMIRHPTKIPPWTAWAASRFHSYAVGDGALVAKAFSVPVLLWGARTALSALVQMCTTDRWRRAAFAGRFSGLIAGFVRFSLARLR